MNAVAQVHWFAAAALERLLFCLVEGTALVVAVTALLQFVPGKDSRTRFRLWFSALLATAALPVLSAFWKPESLAAASRPALSISFSVAEYVIAAWLLIAAAGVARVLSGLVQVRRLRRQCQALDVAAIGGDLAEAIAEFRKQRLVELLVCHRANVPSAIGFFKPAVVIPAWLAEEGASNELKHVVLHELAHLRRYDDWTNLAQQLLKAVLFFHPAVWWMERNLVLDREMACDDAVLAQTGSPRVYAQCLARVAEKSFLRRQLALAQAAVSRVRQLSRRVARILDTKRPQATPVWKPAVPLVMAMALICGAAFPWMPSLVQVGGVAATPIASSHAVTGPLDVNQVRPAGVHLVPASLTQSADRSPAIQSKRAPAQTALPISVPAKFVPANSQTKLVPARMKPQTQQSVRRAAARGPQEAGWPEQHRKSETAASPVIADRRDIAPSGPSADPAASAEGYSGYVLVVTSQQTVISGPQGVQVKVVEVRMLVPVSEFLKQFPRKT